MAREFLLPLPAVHPVVPSFLRFISRFAFLSFSLLSPFSGSFASFSPIFVPFGPSLLSFPSFIRRLPASPAGTSFISILLPIPSPHYSSFPLIPTPFPCFPLIPFPQFVINRDSALDTR
ncbi:hypothetical protein FA13DRAFT_774034 [Coprinellus micaceus]|uniref:Uncharacterized protein n=1 Tax=Coprinellus micaceus TaxID=71717 RepID=A0A4Y7T3V0_COPMI|nr:hypothetical protein FA13DRAFT_774034 [Coprinellus micaceus]